MTDGITHTPAMTDGITHTPAMTDGITHTPAAVMAEVVTKRPGDGDG